MTVYISMLFIVVLLAMGTQPDFGKSYGLQKNSGVNKIILTLIIIVMSLVAGLRYYVGTDFPTYKGLFEYYMSLPWSQTIKNTEGFFWVISSFVGKLTENVTWTFVIHAFVIVTLTIVTISRKSSNFPFSLFLYITMMYYFSSFNGIRQWTAATILFLGSSLIQERKWIKYFILICFAFMFHNTAVFMIPIYFFVTRKAWSKSIMLVSFGMLVFIWVFPGITNSLFNLMEGSNYQHFLVQDINDDGVNILRVAVLAVPVLISFIYRNELLYELDADGENWMNILMNFSLLTFLLSMLATRNTVLYRLTMYTSLYNVLLIPNFADVVFRKNRAGVTMVIALLFFVYMCMLLPVDSNLLPYQSVLGKGGY